MEQQQPLPSPAEAAKHVTIWNRHEHRKIAGNAAPLRRNLDKYLKKHPECEEYTGQDKDPNRAPIDPVTGQKILHLNEHVPIWHKLERRKVTGNAAPLRKNLDTYLRKHPHCEVYNSQDKVTSNDASAGVWPSLHSQAGGRRGASAVTSRVHVLGSAGAGAPRFGKPASQGMGTAASSMPLASSGTTSGARSGVQARNGQQLRNSVYENAYSAPGDRTLFASGRQPTPPFGQPAQSPFGGAAQTGVTQSQGFSGASPSEQVSHGLHPATPSYSEMVSSWSNHSAWRQPYPVSVGSFGVHRGVGTPQQGPLFSSSQNYHSAALDGPDGINGIPIPGGAARDRGDVVMGISFGASLGTSAVPHDLACFLSGTPRSVEPDADLMQFSPSQYLTMGSVTGRSSPGKGTPTTMPPKAFPPN